MKNSLNIKKQLHKQVEEILNKKIKILHEVIASAKESRDSDTKSSVGDKYETGRAMMQIEIGKNEAQLNTTLKLKNDISRINPDIKSNQVEFGSVVITNKGKYFIAIAVGKIEIDKESFYSISLVSPIGKNLQAKKTGDSFIFQNKEIIIEDVF